MLAYRPWIRRGLLVLGLWGVAAPVWGGMQVQRNVLYAVQGCQYRWGERHSLWEMCPTAPGVWTLVGEVPAAAAAARCFAELQAVARLAVRQVNEPWKPVEEHERGRITAIAARCAPETP